MQYLREMTGAAFCGLFRLTDDRTRVTMVVGAAQTARGSAAYAASVREVAMTLDNTMAGRAIRTGEQLIIKNIAETEKANALNNWLIENRSTACIATPLTMLDEREAFNLLFTEPMSDSTFLEEQAELARDAAIILGPMLRRVKDEANSRRFRRAVECSPDPVLITEAAPFAAPGSRVVYCNQAFLDLTGHHLDQVIGHCPRFLHGPGTEPDALKTLQTAMQAWEPVRQIITHYKADGTPFQVELNLAPVADSNGEYSHWVCIQRDVTFQVTQAAERDAHLRELRALLAVIPNAILQYHRDGPNVWRKAFVSDSIEMITGFTTTEASSVDWATKQMREEDLDLLRDNLELAYACGTATVEFRIRHRDGDLRLIQAKMCSYVGARGDTEVIATWTDVTRERRTAAQLDQAARLADLGELAAGLVHELNRPLAAMMLLSENALRALNKGPEYLGHVAGKLGAITKLAQQGADMVSHVQVFSRIDTGESAPIALNMLLNDLMILAQPKFLDSHVSVEFKIPADLPKIYVKPVPLEQVLINLISNSCDAYELATPRIDASQRKIWIDTHAEQNRVIIHVRDRAGGIPPQHLPFLFDAFFTTKPAGKGTGLGLSISSGIVREMGGNLSVFNDQGGAVFVLDLPTAGG
jgi:PAS domain S-box-containing protein